MEDNGNKGWLKNWSWWLYIVVGAFIIALLIWIFVSLSSDEEKTQELQPIEATQ